MFEKEMERGKGVRDVELGRKLFTEKGDRDPDVDSAAGVVYSTSDFPKRKFHCAGLTLYIRRINLVCFLAFLFLPLDMYFKSFFY